MQLEKAEILGFVDFWELNSQQLRSAVAYFEANVLLPYLISWKIQRNESKYQEQNIGLLRIKFLDAISHSKISPTYKLAGDFT